MSKDLYKIKPAGRIITAIGSDLIKDAPAAIVELVKNSYDADAKKVSIEFSNFVDQNDGSIGIRILIKDDGHGMSGEKVKNAWLVPATSDKKDRKYSPGGRLMQGKKGLGRYSSAILGNRLVMKTVSTDGEATTVELDWNEFDRKQYLDEIEVAINTYTTNEEQGTYLEILGNFEKHLEWTDKEFYDLMKDLKKLLIPVDEIEDDFKITIAFGESIGERYANQNFDIEPFPLIDLYDYRLSGDVDEKGVINCIFENKSQKGIPEEILKPIKTYLEHNALLCGKLEFDFRVFDKDPESIDELIRRGSLKHENGKELRRNEVKEMLKEISGISIYRENFRIRPYGDPGYDWLELDKARVNDPAKKISNDQIVGIIKIQEEEKSSLEEKSARDGLRENRHYFGLMQIVKRCITELGERRYEFRYRTGKGRKSRKPSQELDKILDFTKMSKEIEEKLTSINVSPNYISEIQEIINKVTYEKSGIIQEIKDAIAVYQGQATLGKIVMFILHEGRKPIAWLRNQPKMTAKWLKSLGVVQRGEVEEKEVLEKIFERLEMTVEEATKIALLFKKIDPLSVTRRGRRSELNISSSVMRAIQYFEAPIEEKNIALELNLDPKLTYFGWEEDLVMSISNLIENSVYWLDYSEVSKLLSVDVYCDNGLNVIEISDSGPGIELEEVEIEKIFNPGYSTKPGGTGLGLAIAGEATERLNGKLKAIKSSNGACFRMELKGDESDEY